MEDKVALVTGSTSGVGLAVVKTLVTKGCSVVVTGLGQDSTITNIVAELNILKCHPNQSVQFVPVNLLRPEEIHNFVDQVFGLFPAGVDILVNNAGIQHVESLERFHWSKWEEMLALHLSAPFLLIQRFLPKMKEKGWGRIINIGSVHSIIGAANKVAYTTTKHGLLGLTKAVALDAAEFGVTCNAVCPGLINSPMATQTIQVDAEEKGIPYEEAKVMLKFVHRILQSTHEDMYVKARHPTGKLVEVDQIADTVVFLCTSAGDNMTGSTLMMDGGYTAR
ncbi:D-beta-hydroxybutyrate dehydrogenase-like [Liolophura sinensis]|uniref:D-beta-hydroxybutyrate dehydrogenase-like n=1 Tax=Liolophura sinensis TaxID=3198878 RepID=UPI003158E6F4